MFPQARWYVNSWGIKALCRVSDSHPMENIFLQAAATVPHGYGTFRLGKLSASLAVMQTMCKLLHSLPTVSLLQRPATMGSPGCGTCSHFRVGCSSPGTTGLSSRLP